QVQPAGCHRRLSFDHRRELLYHLTSPLPSASSGAKCAVNCNNGVKSVSRLRAQREVESIRTAMSMAEQKKEEDGETTDDPHRRLQESEAANLTDEQGPATAWDRVKLARHPNRPYTLDYIELMFADFCEIHGDRRFADDPAIVTGTARFN